MILERELEQKFVMRLKGLGCMPIKLISPGLAGIPDRLLLIPGGIVWFAELKRPGGRLRPLQAHVIQQLRGLGFRVYIIDSMQAIDDLLADVKGVIDVD